VNHHRQLHKSNRLIEYDHDKDTAGGITEHVYDANATRVVRITDSGGGSEQITHYIGGIYEADDTNSSATSYYTYAGQTIALHDGTNRHYIIGDHLGSTAATIQYGSTTINRTYYGPWGATRATSGTIATDHTYTGQIAEPDNTAAGNKTTDGLIFYNARYYDPTLARFISPDTIIPNPTNPQHHNRYTYVSNGPVDHQDPSGHSRTSLKFDSGGFEFFQGGLLYGLDDFKDPPGTPIGSGTSRKPWDPRAWWNWFADDFTGEDAGDYADTILEYATALGIDPFLLWAIVEHESPHNWPRPFNGRLDRYKVGIDPDQASIGMTQITFDTFADTVMRHPDAFGDIAEGGVTLDEWMRLIDDDELAIRTTAYIISDLQADLGLLEVGVGVDSRYLLALGYAVDGGYWLRVVKGHAPLSAGAAEYLSKIASTYSQAIDFYCGGSHGFACR
jgi:RHS repeat-associated protein